MELRGTCRLRFGLVAALLVVICGAGALAQTKAPRRPNLLFILTDQQRRDTLGAYGNSVIRTPNLDALARSSVVFERCYVTQPVCTPSRASIMTGLYPHSHGSWHN
ncbi:MAG: N-acetylgalactosamine-6-sulfatase, partial [Deltaproteobacteria bacterium]